MGYESWHLVAVAAPSVLIATALWGLLAGAVKDAVAVGSMRDEFCIRIGGRDVCVPTVPAAYVLGFGSVSFIYGYALAIGPWGDEVVYSLAVVTWVSAALLIVPYRRLRRGTRALLSAANSVERIEGAQHRAEDAQHRAEARYQYLTDSFFDFGTHHAPDGTYLWVSPSYRDLLGRDPADLVGKSPAAFTHPDDLERIVRERTEARERGEEPKGVVRSRVRHADGHYVWIETITQDVRDDDGALVRVESVSRDVTDQMAFEEKLRRQAHYDLLTGLANRTHFTTTLDGILAATRHGRTEPFAVLYLDLDRFKAVNDRLGHAAGDELLVQLALRLKSIVRVGDMVGRLGGDEFAVILDGLTSEPHAIETARRIEAALREPFSVGGTTRSVTTSIGIVLGRPDHDSAGALLREADLAAYAVKDRGRAGYSLFTPVLREASDRRLRLESDLERAIERGELRVAYQPIVRLGDGRMQAVEALLRWDHPELGLLAPDTFIAIAEETGRINVLDQWVMAMALEQLEAWDAEAGGPLDLSVSVNCSAGDLDSPRFAEHVRALLAAGPRRAGRLVVEVTESLVVDDVARVAFVLNSLRQDGVRFAMDDFGTGYSSLSVVHALPLDAIKIDREFVRRMHEEAPAREMVRTIVGFARTMGTQIVAEGIETPAQLAALTGFGCDYGQGYLFERPVSPDVISDILRAEAPPWEALVGRGATHY